MGKLACEELGGLVVKPIADVTERVPKVCGAAFKRRCRAYSVEEGTVYADFCAAGVGQEDERMDETKDKMSAHIGGGGTE